MTWRRILMRRNIDINNVGSIVQALFASVGEGWSKQDAEKAQASQVGIISVCSFVGRFAIGGFIL
jgi:hypothetical protein